jgi:hypothetical protein
MTGTVIFQRRADMTDRATPDAAADTTDLFEIIRTTRSMRRLPMPAAWRSTVGCHALCERADKRPRDYSRLYLPAHRVPRHPHGSLLTRRWRKQDSNFQSHVQGLLVAVSIRRRIERSSQALRQGPP